MTDSGWRADPAWTLAELDPSYWGDRKPPEKPPAEAELANPPHWASLYADRRPAPVATWYRATVPADAATSMARA